ncbi:hypothetical protein CARUB_v10018447mg [Capsella rubella]|uniref:Neprosin PEP catalytic domain-containing protein n=1 Tax=Capsella rubella TaxID=81985 RepID=R0HMI7_9BRAS|nr:hypothetical protein CARUB_v10018447mg [Capsella rubella]
MICRITTSLIVIVILLGIVTRSEYSNTRDVKVDRLLKKLNKPYVKSIKSPDGDIIDCVHMKNHPIYDHPLFKNHTIQMRPSSYPEGWTNKYSNNKKQNMVAQLWTINGICPKDSIPIRRTRKEDILRAKSIEKYGKKEPNNMFSRKSVNQPRQSDTHEYAILRLQPNSPQTKFHGTQAFLNVWRPHVQDDGEFSLAQVWVVAGNYSTLLNSIEAGWQVLVILFYFRPFVYWTADSYRRTGCYNTMCSGFVAINQEFALGAPILQVSFQDGQQIELFVSIWKDHSTGNWWLKFGPHFYVGYWPNALFNTLQTGGAEVHWGGEIVNLKNHSRHTTTVMGSGSFAETGYKKASYFRNIQILDEYNTVKQPVSDLRPAVTHPSCYTIRYGTNHPTWKTYFYYGGPGGTNPFCTL